MTALNGALPGAEGASHDVTLRRAVSPTSWPVLAAAALSLIGGAILWMVNNLAYQGGLRQLSRDAQVAAQLDGLVLESELEKQRSVPLVLADDGDVAAALRAPSAARAMSIKLARLQPQTKSANIYVLDAKGKGVASSDWDLPTSAIGSDYAFRDYFKLALKDGNAEQFALGTNSRHPGLYLAHRVEANSVPVGVVVVKVEFDRIEAAWARTRDETFITDRAGTILLTSQPSLRFHPFPRPRPDQMVTSLPVPAQGWRLQLLSSKRPADDQARSATLIAGLVEALTAILAAWFWRAQKLGQERAEAKRNYLQKLELSAANTRLSEEIHERKRAESRLNALQADLVQANKLAQLGQITAGVAHEINQPLATIRVLADTALSGLAKGARPIRSNLTDIVRMCERIGHITGELRAFSRKANNQTMPTPLKASIESSILLTRSRQRTNHVRIVRETLDTKLKVMGDRVRLEQVLVNLLQNAVEALEDRPDPKVALEVTADADWVTLTIGDNGPGLDPEVAAGLFTPFMTTKANGLGLGLVIARDILRDFGGELRADSSPEGAVFSVRLRVARP